MNFGIKLLKIFIFWTFHKIIIIIIIYHKKIRKQLRTWAGPWGLKDVLIRKGLYVKVLLWASVKTLIKVLFVGNFYLWITRKIYNFIYFTPKEEK